MAERRGLIARLRARLLKPRHGSIVAVRTAERLAALTFDDGPDPVSTPAVLDALARHGMKATFFMVGARAARHPELVARVVAEGHEIGNHSWDHPSLPTLPPAAQGEQIAWTRAALAPPHGQRLLRPPYGHQTLATLRAARAAGYRTVLWSVSGGDWRGDDAAALADRIAGALRPGGIVLLHDSLFTFETEAARDRGPTIAALGLLAERIAGYRFVTVSKLLAAGPPVLRYVEETARPGWLESQKVAPA
jgi:peptidoglycan/xylan/chitin deacetylase (PgdA/CDA1 family)